MPPLLTFGKEMSDDYNQVLESWNAAQVSLVRSLDYEATVERFRAAGLNPPEDFTKLYSIVGGMPDCETDHTERNGPSLSFEY